MPGGTAASREACVRADGQLASSRFAASSRGACLQHAGSGHFEAERFDVSRPSNQPTWSNGTPTLTENSPPGSTRAVHQYVPLGVSVYWKYGLNRSATRWTVRDVKRLHAYCPSIAPSGSVGNGSPSFEYALWTVPEEWTFMKCTGSPRWAVARFVKRCAAVSYETPNTSRSSSTEIERFFFACCNRGTASDAGSMSAADR